MNKSTKILAIVLAVVLLSLAAVVGTLAYLVAQTQQIDNVFVVGANVKIELAETTGEEYEIVLGGKAAKDPVLTVKSNSEDCWVFVEIIAADGIELKADDTDDNAWVTYSMGDGWVKLDLGAGDDRVIYGRNTAIVIDEETPADIPLQVLAGDATYTTGVVNFENRNSLPANDLTLSFKAYAIQEDGFADKDLAWDALDAQLKAVNP